VSLFKTFNAEFRKTMFSPVIGQGDSKSMAAQEKAVTNTIVQSK
jgi:hypothetical protein